MTLGLPTAEEEKPVIIAPQLEDTGTVLVRQMEASFAVQDWPDVMRKADYLIKHLPGNATATVYRLHGLALLEEGEAQQGQEALETALALVSDRQLRLTLLGDYTTLLASQNQWAKVLRQTKEALRLVPNDPGWLATQKQAQSQLVGASPIKSKPQAQIETRDKETQSVPQKTKEQWLTEGNALRDLKRYDEALAAYEQAIRLDPKYPLAYNSKGATLYVLKRYDEALAANEQAIRLDPNYAFAYYVKGLALDNLGKSREAKQAYDKARQLGYTG
jgi:tetratricopeptide (TPR) repeat protein